VETAVAITNDKTNSITIKESGELITSHYDGFDWPGQLTFESVNDFVHDSNREYEEIQYLCLGLASKLDAIRLLVTTDHESKDEFISRVNDVLKP